MNTFHTRMHKPEVRFCRALRNIIAPKSLLPFFGDRVAVTMELLIMTVTLTAAATEVLIASYLRRNTAAHISLRLGGATVAVSGEIHAPAGSEGKAKFVCSLPFVPNCCRVVSSFVSSVFSHCNIPSAENQPSYLWWTTNLKV